MKVSPDKRSPRSGIFNTRLIIINYFIKKNSKWRLFFCDDVIKYVEIFYLEVDI